MYKYNERRITGKYIVYFMTNSDFWSNVSSKFGKNLELNVFKINVFIKHTDKKMYYVNDFGYYFFLIIIKRGVIHQGKQHGIIYQMLSNL